MKICLCVVLCVMACPVLAGEKDPPKPYKDDPAVIAKVKALGEVSGLNLGKFKVVPKAGTRLSKYFAKGPGHRDYGNKIAYAPDRGTGLYCGGNHNSPHRLNDAWEFHLGSNSWHLVCPPGNDYRHLNTWNGKAKKDKAFREKEYPALARKWWNTCKVEDGYIQAKKGGGPVNPRHTWDGLTYDHHARKLYWAVLDISQEWKVKKYAAATGQDAAALMAKIKPGSTMYIYDPVKMRWTRQMGEGPFPRMHGMGGSLVYLPDLKKTIWYCAAQNRTPNDFGMWSYDAKTNKWTELLTYKQVFSLAKSKKQAPGSEVQCAYSVKHKKIVAVLEKGTYVYDVPKNSWKRAADTTGYAHDAHSVFAYDSNADVFLMVSKSKRHATGEPWRLHAYDLETDKWETVKVKGSIVPDDSKRKAWRSYTFTGYYDAGNNALVLYEARMGITWIYRHAKAAK